MDDNGNLDRLPSFKDALNMSKEEYYRFANGFFEYRSNCQMALMMPDKFLEWCKAFDCTGEYINCRIPLHPSEITTATLSVTQSPGQGHSVLMTTTTYMQMIHSLGHNGSCYDDFFCNEQSTALYLHYILGITSLILCLFGIFSTSVFIPTFNVASNRTGATLYLTTMAVFDCVYMVLFTLIIVIRYIPTSYVDQVEMYGRFTANLIPHGIPTMQLMELFSVWITVALLVDRFLYLKLGFHSKIICSRILSAKIIGVILFILIVYTIPKYLEYHIVEYPKVGILKVMYTAIGINESFQNVLLHWLKVPIEMFLPYLAVAIFSVLNSIKFYDLMFKRKLSEASKEKRNGVSQLQENSIYPINDVDESKTANKFPSLTVPANIPLISNSIKSVEDKENLNVIISLILGFSLITFKIPKFILHALKSEEYVDMRSTKFFQPVTDFLDLVWVALRPLVYITVASHFRIALKYVCCCESKDDPTIVKVLPAIPMTDLADEYIRHQPPDSCQGNVSYSAKVENLKLLDDGYSEDTDGGLFIMVAHNENGTDSNTEEQHS